MSIKWYCCCHNLCRCAYPFGLNLFFQPGLGPGFFFTLDSSGVFGLRLLLRIVPFRALAEEFKRITPGLCHFLNDEHRHPPLVWIRLKRLIIWHPLFSTLLQLIFRDDPAHTRRVYTESTKYVRHGCDSINGQKEANLSDRSLSAALSSGWAGGENASSGPEKSEGGT